jgi:hypothetical protein
MLSNRHNRPSPAMVVAMLALFVSLGGTSIAATKLARDSVGARQLKTGAVTTGKLRNSAVTGAKVANGSITGVDIDMSRLGKVPAAVEADRISGQAVGCPAGTLAAVAACVEASTRAPLALQAAIAACAAGGGRLPTTAELIGALSVGIRVADPELAADITPAGPPTLMLQRVVYADGETLVNEPATNARRFRCLSAPVRSL